MSSERNNEKDKTRKKNKNKTIKIKIKEKKRKKITNKNKKHESQKRRPFFWAERVREERNLFSFFSFSLRFTEIGS